MVDEKEIKLKVMKLEGVDTFIYHVNGKVTISALLDIKKKKKKNC